MKHREPVSKIMSKQLVTVSVNQSLEEVDTIFDTRNIRHVPVTSGDELVGMLSKTDLLRVSFVDDYASGDVSTQVYSTLSISQVMTKNIQSITPHTTIREAAQMLVDREFHALPVVEEGALVGIVTTTDLVKYLLDQY